MSHLNLKDSFLGSHISSVIDEAKIHTEKYDTVSFEFNGITCVVDKSTMPEYLERDFMNAHVMGWKTIGPKCEPWYDTDTEIELYSRKLASAKKRKEDELADEKKSNEEKATFLKKVEGVNIELKEELDWQVGKNKNTDPYGACIYEYAEGWARLMQVEMSRGVKLIDCAERTSFELGFLGITGFMYGVAVSILSHCWVHGEELRIWHNKEYKHEGEGVVNPAF